MYLINESELKSWAVQQLEEMYDRSLRHFVVALPLLICAAHNMATRLSLLTSSSRSCKVTLQKKPIRKELLDVFQDDEIRTGLRSPSSKQISPNSILDTTNFVDALLARCRPSKVSSLIEHDKRNFPRFPDGTPVPDKRSKKRGIHDIDDRNDSSYAGGTGSAPKRNARGFHNRSFGNKILQVTEHPPSTPLSPLTAAPSTMPFNPFLAFMTMHAMMNSGTIQQVGDGSAPKRKCSDYHYEGTCHLGETCLYEHSPIVPSAEPHEKCITRPEP